MELVDTVTHEAISFWLEDLRHPLDPNQLDLSRTCRIYDSDMERFAIVDEEFYAQLVTMRDAHSRRYGTLVTRKWYIKPLHPRRNGKKLYFVSNAGWRTGGQVFLHVMVMRLSGILPPSPKHKLVNHVDGDEWNCRLSNLEWATHLMNAKRRKKRKNEK